MSLWKQVHAFLLDFSARQREEQMIAAILREALSQSTTDEEFERALRRILRRDTTARNEVRYQKFVRKLWNYQTAGSEAFQARVLAQRYLTVLEKNLPAATPVRD